MDASDTEVSAATAPGPGERAARLARAETLVKDHMVMSLAAGLVPVPLLDLAAGAGIQLFLLKRLCDLYGVPFVENVARGVVLSLLGGMGAGAVASGLFATGVKLIPGADTVLGVVSMPVSLAAFTYALGKVFTAHLELGGSLLDFDAAANRGAFRDMARSGRRVAETLTPPPASSPPNVVRR
jgi:uncharacterized protein (DUF697 family)